MDIFRGTFSKKMMPVLTRARTEFFKKFAINFQKSVLHLQIQKNSSTFAAQFG